MAEKETNKPNKRKFALWAKESTLDITKEYYKKDNYSSQSEFIEKAIVFYVGYLSAEDNKSYLPNVIVSTLKGIVAESENKQGRALFKLAVEMAIMRGKVDMIITKSISRFARNTLDCLKYTRMLKAIGVDVFFEEQGIHSTQPGAEFYITIYGSIAQSESENISANVKFGKAQSAREGNVAFHYKNFLGYRKGEDGKPEIVPEEAETVRLIYESFLAGDSIGGLKVKLEKRGILSPSGKSTWNHSTIVSILTNEKYTGDAIINKTYIEDCISKKVKVNNGERQKFYVENNHPAIIDRMTFARVQEELARRNGKLMSRNSPRNKVKNRTKRKRFPRTNRKCRPRKQCKNAQWFNSKRKNAKISFLSSLHNIPPTDLFGRRNVFALHPERAHSKCATF